MKKFLRYTAMAAILALPLQASAKDAWPTKPVTIVVPFPPGGATDVMARLIAPHIEREIGQPVVVENRAGAGGSIGSNYVARAGSDGYTFLWGTVATHGIGPNIYPSLPYDVAKDFDPVIKAVDQPYVLVTHPSLGITDVKTLIEQAKAAPGSISTANAGVGTGAHMILEKFQAETGSEFLQVPYKGAGPAMVDLLGGQVDMTFDVILTTAPYIEDKRLVPLAVTSSERSSKLPDVPTLQEAGIENFEAIGWNGLFAPAGTSPEVIEKMNLAINQALESDEIRERILKDGSIPAGGTPQEARENMDSELKSWGEVARKANVVIN